MCGRLYVQSLLSAVKLSFEALFNICGKKLSKLMQRQWECSNVKYRVNSEIFLSKLKMFEWGVYFEFGGPS